MDGNRLCGEGTEAGGKLAYVEAKLAVGWMWWQRLHSTSCSVKYRAPGHLVKDTLMVAASVHFPHRGFVTCRCLA